VKILSGSQKSSIMNSPMERFKILVVGESCVYRYHFGKHRKFNDEMPAPTISELEVHTFPGLATDIGVRLAALGHQAVLVSNDDEIMKDIFVDKKSGYHLLHVENKTSCDSCSQKKLKNIISDEFDATIIVDNNSGFLSSTFLQKMMPKLPKPIFVETKKEKISVFEGCIIKLSEERSRQVSSFPLNYELIVTLPAGGAYHRGIHYPASVREVFDIQGLDDAFFVGFIVRYIETSSISESIEFGNVCSEKVTQHRGYYNVTLGDVGVELKDYR